MTPPPPLPDLVADLTPPQREAVLHTQGPLLVLAGPGSGKTRVITRRIAHLIASGVPPWQLLAVTFTNKAAGEMKHRVATLVGEGPIARGLTVTTFHSLCVRLLRRYADLAAHDGHPIISAGFTVFDADDQMALMKKVLAELDLSSSNWPPRSVLTAISAAKNELLEPKDYAARAADFHSRTVSKVYERYEKALRAANAADFDDLLMLTAKMLRHSGAVRSEVQSRYRYLLIDEYQDTNKAQFVIASLIAGDGKSPGASGENGPNICVVGDPDQSIYGWRGADIANILEFEEHYPGAKVIALGDNFRSLSPIITVADQLIRQNKRRKHKPLSAVRPSKDAEHVEVTLCRDEHHEAALVLDWLKHLREQGSIDWRDAAVFYRTNALSRVIEDTLRNAGVPYVIVRGTAFYQREEIKNALAYLRVAANPHDSVSLARIINTPARGIGNATLERVESSAAARGISMLDALRDIREVPGLTPRAQTAVAKFVAMIDAWASRPPDEPTLMKPDEPRTGLAALVESVVKDSGLEQMYKTEEERLENLAELVSSASEFEQAYTPEPETTIDANGELVPVASDGSPPKPASLAELLNAYLERVALVADTDAINPDQGAVTLMTLHAAKGLEYKAVAMIGLEETILPHMRAQQSDAELEEERRLCFVGITRAMDRLLITSARYRTLRGLSERMIPSRFLDEIRGPLVRSSDQSDPLGFEGSSAGDRNMRDFLGGGAGGTSRGKDAFGAPLAPSQHRAAVSVKLAGVELTIGATVRHPQFGLGKVEAVTPGADARVRVKFRDVGAKTLVLAYARLERVP